MNNSYQYDVFISFKNSTENGLTEDRDIAKDVFDDLKEKNTSVFFSNSTLHEKGTANYMLEIQSALEHSRTIVIIFSNPRYISQGWVAQEWMTFLDLSLKDPGRSIFMLSIKQNVSDIPPFLRPYECFTDYDSAITHILRNLNNNSISAEVTMRDFLNAYWELFGNYDTNEAIENIIPNNQFDNYEVYCLRQKMLTKTNINKHIERLRDLSASGNTYAAYVLSIYYRDIQHLDLQYSKALITTAYKNYISKLPSFNAFAEIGIIIWHETDTYNGAFYMAEMLSDVLEAYGINFNVIPYKAYSNVEVTVENYRHIVILLSSDEFEHDSSFITTINPSKNKLFLGLNAFTADALPHDFRSCFTFDSTDQEITKVCRALLS